ncbi:MAG TPA: glutaredoxin domain-containing protein [Bacteroidales bacterium]|nr:glutaredoxin domain-containing protein [Bacteroidales bacterium]
MKLINIGSLEELESINGDKERTFLLLYKSGTENSDCTIKALQGSVTDNMDDITFLGADVKKVRDIHTNYGIETVPALLEFRSGRLNNIFKGCNSSGFFSSVIHGGHSVSAATEGRKQKSVTVYSTPTCTFCNSLKTYLRERKVQFRDIDVSIDQKAAGQMVNKSGQQGVPQTEINGQIIIGFDKKKIDDLLELG